jgi:hypothetical protein
LEGSAVAQNLTEAVGSFKLAGDKDLGSGIRVGLDNGAKHYEFAAQKEHPEVAQGSVRCINPQS